MIEILFPKIYVDSIFHIKYDLLWEEGIRGLIFDVDNTLVSFDIPEPTEEIVKLFSRLKEMGFDLCLVSNNGKGRVARFNKNLGLHSVHKAGKPGARGIKKALELLKLPPQKAAVIGDQVFTDVLCANRNGIYSILVKPTSTRDEFSVRLKRGLEGFVIKCYLRSIAQKLDN